MILGILLPVILWLMPTETVASIFGLEGLTLVQHRLFAIFIFAVTFWVLEPIPVFATSVMIIVLELFMVSNKAFKPLAFDTEGKAIEGLINYKSIMATFASPIILLFLGGFFLAMAATKYRLDTNMARVMLKPFGTNPKNVLLGLMAITAIFSMFMSNTATTAMMLAVLAPVIKGLEAGDRGKAAFVLGIPFAANIGGIGTPIGTPPNAVAQKYLLSDVALPDGRIVDLSTSFGGWMMFAVPYVFVMLIVTWAVLLMMFPISAKEIKIEMKGKFLKTKEAIIVYVTFGATILLWLLGGKVHNLTSYSVAMIPVAVFCATKIITTADLKTMSWDVLWLVSGGVALGLGLGATGLSKVMVSAVPFGEMGIVTVVISSALVGLIMSTFMSNTATANLLLPIMSALGVSLMSGGDSKVGMMLILALTFACSLAMAMPISTPPNALAHATGQINTGDMAKSGIVIGLLGLAGAFALVYILKTIGFFAM